MSSDDPRTFITHSGGGDTTGRTPRIQETTDPTLPLSRPHLSPAKMSSARQTILGAVETLELDNEELRRVNNRMLAEMEQLRSENDQLRKELDDALQEKDEQVGRLETLEEDNRRMEEKMNLQAQHFSDENRKYYATELSLKQDNDKFRKNLENVKSELLKKDGEIHSLSKELNSVRNKLESESQKFLKDKDVELYHEIEMLKEERSDLIAEKDEAQKLSKKISNELKKLENSLEQKTSELRNENRRHQLLTKEFNSLLEENNHLKLQLRRRRQGTNNNENSPQSLKEEPVGGVAPPDATNNLPSRFYNTPSSGGNLNRETSFANESVNYVPKLPQRSALLSREKMRPRDKSTTKSDHGSPIQSAVKESEQEFSLDKNGERKLISKTRNPPGSRSSSDTSPPPEGLPTIAGGRTWRP